MKNISEIFPERRILPCISVDNVVGKKNSIAKHRKEKKLLKRQNDPCE